MVTAGVSDTPDGRQPVITLTGVNAAARRVNIAKIPGAVEPQVAVNSIAAQGSTQVAVGSANGYPAAWTSGNGGGTWTRAVGALPAVLGRPGSQRLTSVTHGPMGWLAVGDVTAAAPEHPVVVVSADGTSWQAADGERVFGASGLFTEQAAANARGYVIVGHQNVKRVQNGRVVSVRTEAAVWWSATLTGWQRGGDATAGALDGTGNRQMNAVTACHFRRGRFRRGGLARRPAVGLDLGRRRPDLAPGRPAHAGRLHPGRARARRERRAASWSRWAPRSPPRAGRCRSRPARPTAGPAGPSRRSRCRPG